MWWSSYTTCVDVASFFAAKTRTADLLGHYSNPTSRFPNLFRELALARENNHKQSVRSKPSDRS